MRVKIYTAPTLEHAKRQIREDLGDDAIILGIETPPVGPVRVTAGRDREVPKDEYDFDDPDDDAYAEAVASAPDDVSGDIRHALSFHGVPSSIVGRLAGHIPQRGANTPTLALADALQAAFRFTPLARGISRSSRPIMVIGPPGAGKTLAIAKLSTRLHQSGQDIQVVSTDMRRAGGVEELAALTRILGVSFRTAACDDQLGVALTADDGPALIDTSGTNPFDRFDQEMLADALAATGAEPVLVLAAGGDPMECIDVAAAYAALGVRRLYVSKLDLARRLGGLLAAADAGGVAFAEASLSYQVAEGLEPLDALTLARFLLPNDIQDDPCPASSETPLLEEVLP